MLYANNDNKNYIGIGRDIVSMAYLLNLSTLEKADNGSIPYFVEYVELVAHPSANAARQGLSFFDQTIKGFPLLYQSQGRLKSKLNNYKIH